MVFLGNPFDLLLRKLRSHAHVSEEDATALRNVPVKLRKLESSAYLLREGERATHCTILISGFAYRQKLTGNGGRQIVSIHVPGDPIDFQNLYLEDADHNVQALSRVEVAFIARVDAQRLMESRPNLAHALFACALIDASIFREWMLNVGRRNSITALAHLLCEFATRLDALGLTDGGRYELPLTQEQIGDALGLTSVHVNRTMKALEARGLIERNNRQIRFPRWKDLVDIGDFSPRYLHLNRHAEGPAVRTAGVGAVFA